MSTAARTRSKTTTEAPVSRLPPQGSDLSSSAISPRTPAAPTEVDRYSRVSRSHRSSLPASEARDEDDRRKSTVTFAAKKSLAPSDSVSHVKSRAPRTSQSSFSPMPQGSQTTRRRSQPWEDVSYGDAPSRRGSTRGGTAWSGTSGSRAPLNEENLEAFNERGGRADDASASTSAIRRGDGRYTMALTTRRASTWYDEPESDQQQVDARSLGQDTRRTPRRYSSAVIDEELDSKQRTSEPSRRRSKAITRPRMPTRPSYSDSTYASRQRSSAIEGSTRGGEPSRAYATRATSSTVPSATTRRKSEAVAAAGGAAAGAYAERRYSRYASDAPASSVSPSASRTSYSKTSTRAKDVYATAAARRRSSQSQVVSSNGTETQATQRNATTEVKSRRETEATQPNARTEVKSRRDSVVSGKASQSPKEASGETALVATRKSPTSHGGSTASPSTSKPIVAGIETWPFSDDAPDDSQWERKVHVITTQKPDGRLIRDEQVSVRRIRPSQEQTISA